MAQLYDALDLQKGREEILHLLMQIPKLRGTVRFAPWYQALLIAFQRYSQELHAVVTGHLTPSVLSYRRAPTHDQISSMIREEKSHDESALVSGREIREWINVKVTKPFEDRVAWFKLEYEARDLLYSTLRVKTACLVNKETPSSEMMNILQNALGRTDRNVAITKWNAFMNVRYLPSMDFDTFLEKSKRALEELTEGL